MIQVCAVRDTKDGSPRTLTKMSPEPGCYTAVFGCYREVFVGARHYPRSGSPRTLTLNIISNTKSNCNYIFVSEFGSLT